MAAAEAKTTRTVRAEAMKILRSVNRRDFSVEPAGFFNVLRPNTRFIASHLQRRFPYLVRQSKGTETAEPLQLLKPSTQDHGMLRPALIVLAAIAITLIALSWIDGNLFAHNFGW
jgi:hypothetical protein